VAVQDHDSSSSRAFASRRSADERWEGDKPDHGIQPVAEPLGVSVDELRTVFNAWGPSKFDAEVFLDSQALRPDGTPGAMLIPSTFGLAGVDLHTWTGWGSVTHWNAFVANLERHGKGAFFDPLSKRGVACQAPLPSSGGRREGVCAWRAYALCST
jgi:hypothetical protein